MKDAEIDYSDIPPLDKSFLKRATTAWPPVKKQLTIRLDADVLAWLKAQGRGYQTRINRILRVVMESQPPAPFGELAARCSPTRETSKPRAASGSSPRSVSRELRKTFCEKLLASHTRWSLDTTVQSCQWRASARSEGIRMIANQSRQRKWRKRENGPRRVCLNR